MIKFAIRQKENNMKNRFRFSLLTTEETNMVYNASLEVLEKTGLVFPHESALKLFNDEGAYVDFKKSIVRFPPELVKTALRKVSSGFSLYDSEMKKRLNIDFSESHFCSSYYDLWILNYNTYERRRSKLKDVENLVRISDALENIEIVGEQVLPQDIPIPLMQIKAAETVFRNTSKPSILNLLNLEDAKYIIKMAEAITGDEESFIKKPIMGALVCTNSPLKYDKNAIDVIYETTHHGVPIAINPCPIAGATSPATLAGMLTQAIAEALAGIVLIKLLNKDAPVFICTTPFILGPKGNLIMGAPENYLVQWGFAQIAFNFGIPNSFSSTLTDSKIPTIQLGYEKSMGLMLAIMSGSCIISVPAILDEGATTAYEQLVIESEMVNVARRILEGIDCSFENLAVNLINQVGHEGKFLFNPQTAKHFRSEIWLPRILFKGTWEEVEKRTIIDNAKKKLDEILNGPMHKLSATTSRSLDEIVHEAKKNLLNSK